MAKKVTKKVTKKRVKKNVERGQAHIQASFNNTIVTVSDLQRMKQFDQIVLRMRMQPFKTSFVPDFKIDWGGEQYPKMTYPEREKRPVQVFDVREFVKEKRQQTCDIISKNRASFIINFIPNLFAPASRDKFYDEIKDLQDSALDSKAEGLILAQQGIACRTSKMELLKTITVPVLFIIGKQDPRISFDMAIAQASLPKHSEVLILENVGHMGHIEAKEILKQRLLSFTYSCFAL